MEGRGCASTPALPVTATTVRALLSALAGVLAGGAVGATLAEPLAFLFASLGGLGAFACYLLHAINRALAASEARLLARMPGGMSAEDDQARAGGASPGETPPAEPVASAETLPDAGRDAAPAAAPASGAAGWQQTRARGTAPTQRRHGDAVARVLRYAHAWLRRGNPIARVGVAILFLGGAFLVKYAADHALLPLELRLAGVALGAIVLLGIGWRLRLRQRLYALTLQGGGVAALYLTVYATLRLYALIPPGVALSLMAVVSLAAAVLAVAQRAQALAVIAFSGGFAAPLLAASGSGDHIALFSYYAVLNLGVFAVAWFRAWTLLNLVGFVFTFGVSGLWRGTAYAPDQLFSTTAFLLLFFGLYVAVSVLFALRQPPNLRGYVSGTLVFGLPVVVSGLLASLLRPIEFGLASGALGFGVFYLSLAWALVRAGWPSLRLLAEAFAALGVIFASLAVPLAFDAGATAVIWAVEGAGLLWLGVRQDRRLARAFGALLQLASAGHYAVGLGGGAGDAMPLLNAAFLGGAGLAAAGVASGFWLYRARSRLARNERYADWVLLVWGVLWWLLAGLGEVARFGPPAVEAGIGLGFLAISALLLEAIGRWVRWAQALRLAPLLAAVLLVFGSAAALEAMHPLARGAWLGWPLLWLVHYLLLHRREGDAGRLFLQADRWLHALGAWTLAVVISVEAEWRIGQLVRGVWPELVCGLVPALLLWLSVRGPGWPLAAQRPAYRFLAALPLALVAVLWLIATSLDSAGDPVALPYVPLLNPLDIASMLVLLALTAWWLALPKAERALLHGGHPALMPGAAAALIFLWLSTALVRAMHHLAGTPLLFDGVMASTPVQAALSIFWGLLALAAMVVATRRQRRLLWLSGAGVMAVVVAKLFVVDLAATGTLARIVSFLGVGVLLLVSGYFSPLPPRRGDALEKGA